MLGSFLLHGVTGTTNLEDLRNLFFCMLTEFNMVFEIENCIFKWKFSVSSFSFSFCKSFI